MHAKSGVEERLVTDKIVPCLFIASEVNVCHSCVIVEAVVVEFREGGRKRDQTDRSGSFERVAAKNLDGAGELD